MFAMKRPKTLSSEHTLTCRSIKQIRQAMRRAVTQFDDEREIRFRGRPLSSEAYINAAVWSMAELSRSDQERILRTYLPRIEAYLAGDPEGGEAAPNVAEGEPTPPVPYGREPSKKSKRSTG